MQLYGVLVLLVTLSTAWGLKCYCSPASKNCTDTMECPPSKDSCTSTIVNGATLKGCGMKGVCPSPMKCCQRDLCNSATPTGSSVLLLLVSSAIITLFL